MRYKIWFRVYLINFIERIFYAIYLNIIYELIERNTN